MLLLLLTDGPKRPREIAEQLTLPFPAVTRYLQLLHEGGLVTIERLPHDRCSYSVTITLGGIERIAAFRDALVDRVTPALVDVPADDLADTVRTLETNTASFREHERARPSRPRSPWWREPSSADDSADDSARSRQDVLAHAERTDDMFAALITPLIRLLARLGVNISGIERLRGLRQRRFVFDVVGDRLGEAVDATFDRRSANTQPPTATTPGP